MRNSKLITKPFLAGLLLLSQFALPGQQRDAQKEKVPNEDEPKIVGHYATISVNVQVLSAATGSVVGDLTRNDFVISENEVQQDIFAWRRLPAPLSLLILIDAASSNAHSQTVDNQVNSLKSSLTDLLEPGETVSIVEMNERPIVLQDHTNNKQLINAALDRISQHKAVSELQIDKRMSRGLQVAAERARDVQNPEARSAVILISDLPEKAAEEMVLSEALVRATLESESIFCWNRSANFTSPFSEEGKYSLDKVSLTDLVGLTGGEFVNSDWKSFLERLRRRYQIVYLPFTRQREGQVVRIKLKLKPSAKRGSDDLVLNYPRMAIIPSVK
jgi:VWFA-related protein